MAIEIRGLDSLMHKLDMLGRDSASIVDESLSKSAYSIKREAEKNIQAVGATDTGELLRSIHTEKLGQCRYAVGTAVKYAPMIEFGTGFKGDPQAAHTARLSWVYFDKNTGGFRTGYPQPARPFLRPAFEAMKDVVAMNIRRDLIKAALEMTGGTP